MILNLRKIVFQSVKSSLSRRFLHNRCALVFESHGDPLDVIKLDENRAPESLDTGKVRVKVLAAPINPSDINSIQGTYGVIKALPQVGGNEGVGEVVEVGDDVELKPGDRVISKVSGAVSTWQSETVTNADNLIRVPVSLDLLKAATLAVNPASAFRMLSDFVALKKGDVVIQNGANSAVGQAVISLCKHWGFHSINVIRDRPDDFGATNELKEFLTDTLGANEVITETELAKTLADIAKARQPKLALNCVCGKNGTNLARTLGSRGVLVTYGAMSKQPLIVPAGPIIFNELQMFGFWMTKWKQRASQKDIDEMFSALFDFCQMDVIKTPRHRLFSIRDYREALKHARQPFSTSKAILSFSD